MNFLPLSPPSTFQPSPSPEVGDRTMEYRVWPPRSRCNMTRPASQLQKDGLCLPSSFQSLTSEPHRQDLSHAQNLCQDPGTVFWVELDTELQTTPGTATCQTPGSCFPAFPNPSGFLVAYCPLHFNSGIQEGRDGGRRGPRVCSLSVAHGA